VGVEILTGPPDDWPPPDSWILEDLPPCEQCGKWNVSLGPAGWFCDTCLIPHPGPKEKE
jgi:hypothetical protein